MGRRNSPLYTSPQLRFKGYTKGLRARPRRWTIGQCAARGCCSVLGPSYFLRTWGLGFVSSCALPRSHSIIQIPQEELLTDIKPGQGPPLRKAGIGLLKIGLSDAHVEGNGDFAVRKASGTLGITVLSLFWVKIMLKTYKG